MNQIPNNTRNWNSQTIHDEALPLLEVMKSEMGVYIDSWYLLRNPDYYCPAAINASAKMKETAQRLFSDVSALNNSINTLNTGELANDTQFQKTAKIARCAQEYFDTIIHRAFYPTTFNWALLKFRLAGESLSPELLIPAVVSLSLGLSYKNDDQNDDHNRYENHKYIAVFLGLACVTTYALSKIVKTLNIKLRVIPSHVHLVKMRAIFESSFE